MVAVFNSSPLLSMFGTLRLFLLFGIFYWLPSFSSGSHGIRQRNSSVPLRQVVEKSRSQSSALILVVTHNGSMLAPALPAPAGRHAVISGLELAPEACTHCDRGKCAADDGGPGICAIAVEIENGTTLWQRCIGSRKELSRLLKTRSLGSASRDASGCREGKWEGRQERLCWCQPSNSLVLAGEEANSKERKALHARRRKNHHSHTAPTEAPTSSARQKQLRGQSLIFITLLLFLTGICVM